MKNIFILASKYFAKARNYAVAHRRAVLVVLVLIALAGYRIFFGGADAAQARYVLGTVEKETLTVSVSGVGQISSSDQIDVKPKVSANVTSVTVSAGQEVKAGQVLAYLDSRDAAQSVQDARIALDSARIALQKLQQNQTVDATTIRDDVSRAYDDALNTITETFLSLPDTMTDAHTVLYGGQLDGTTIANANEYLTWVDEDRVATYRAMVLQGKNDYKSAQSAYDPVFDAYRQMRRDATPQQIREMLDKTEHVVSLVTQTLVSERNTLDTLVLYLNEKAASDHVDVSIPADVTKSQSVISGIIGTVNGFATSLASQSRAIKDAIQSEGNAQMTDPLDLASQQNTVRQRQADLQNALIDQGDHIVRAPLAGIVAKVSVRKGDAAGSGTAIATIISHQQIVNLSLNEVDVARVKLGQKATLNFDAIEDLSMTGIIREVDSIGTTSQGVVSYNVTIGLDTQDARIRPGMSVSANVIIDVHQNVLVVPIAAVKTQGGSSYVEVLEGADSSGVAAISGVTSATAPNRIMVTVGASSDTMTEILSGLTEGQTIVTRTITTGATTANQPAQNRQGSVIPGVGGGRFVR